MLSVDAPVAPQHRQALYAQCPEFEGMVEPTLQSQAVHVTTLTGRPVMIHAAGPVQALDE